VDDALIDRLILGASRLIFGVINRSSLLLHTVTEKYDGMGSTRLLLKQWPVTSVMSLSVDGGTVLASQTPPLGTGFVVGAWDGNCPGGLSFVDLVGSAFGRGRQNVAVTYMAGYLVSDEKQTIPATPFQVTVNAPQGPFAADVGVTRAGVAMVKVASGPITGQYSIDATGKYTFAAADTGAAVLISYSFVPGDIEMACFEMVGEAYRYRDHIGQQSKSLGGNETASFTRTIMTDYVKELLQPYTSVIPV
jgi:hypothetical protein